MTKQSHLRDALVLGLALFAMFFGAGNLIFPPAIGLEGGSDWFVGYLTYFVADVGLASLAIIAMLKADGKMERVTGSIGIVGAIILNCAMMICVGPLIAIPRTAATSFEMGTSSLLGMDPTNPLGLAIYSIIFFAIVFFAVMRPNKVVSSIGKILTPVLVVTLAVLIIAGIINPAASTSAPTVDNLVQEGVLNGYQTMDMIAGLAFSLVIVSSVKSHKYGSKVTENKVTLIACAVAGVFLFAVYGGLSYLGATTGQLWAPQFADGTMNQAGLLTNISNAILGNAGAGFLAIIVVFACLTTAIGLVSACSSYFAQLLEGKVSYNVIATIMVVFSAFACNIGLSQIISFAAPILTVVYPVGMFLTIMSLINKDEKSNRITCILGAAVSFVISIACVLVDTFGVTALSAVHLLPLDAYGFGWLLPTVVAALIGFALDRVFAKKA